VVGGATVVDVVVGGSVVVVVVVGTTFVVVVGTAVVLLVASALVVVVSTIAVVVEGPVVVGRSVVLVGADPDWTSSPPQPAKTMRTTVLSPKRTHGLTNPD
jgi:hypothetical protein